VEIEVYGCDRVMSLNGLHVRYLEWGEEAATPVVLLHDLGTEAHMWDTLARALVQQDRVRVLVPDLRGHGRTDWAADDAPQRWVEDLSAFVGALASQPVALIGISMGGPTPGATWRPIPPRWLFW
jgi:pimeloyl-ACP methyl ester carboxylesterase